MKLVTTTPRSIWMESPFERLVKNFMENDVNEVHAQFRPQSEVIEYEDLIELKVNLAGVKKDEVDISIDKNTLIIKGTRKETLKENGKVLSSDIIYGSFERSFRLPEHVNTEKITASMEDGILSIILPKLEERKARTITVK